MSEPSVFFCRRHVGFDSDEDSAEHYVLEQEYHALLFPLDFQVLVNDLHFPLSEILPPLLLLLIFLPFQVGLPLGSKFTLLLVMQVILQSVQVLCFVDVPDSHGFSDVLVYVIQMIQVSAHSHTAGKVAFL